MTKKIRTRGVQFLIKNVSIHDSSINIIVSIHDTIDNYNKCKSPTINLILNSFFKANRILALNHTMATKIAGLTLYDFFLWGHLKSKVYFSPPENTDDLKERIVNLLKGKQDLVKTVIA